MVSLSVAQGGLEPLDSSDLPTSASPVLGCTSVPGTGVDAWKVFPRRNRGSLGFQIRKVLAKGQGLPCNYGLHFFFFFFLVALGFELRASTLSHSTSPFS
jgi:hypothetical protein